MFAPRTITRFAALIAITIFSQNQSAIGETLRIGGTGSTNELVKSLGVVFAQESGIQLVLIPSLGTSGANNAVVDGVLDLSISGRPLNADEKTRGLSVVAEFKTPFVLATSHSKPNGIKGVDLAQLYLSDQPVWADGTAVRIILRPTNESDTLLLGVQFPGMVDAITKVRKRSDLTVAATDQDNADLAEKTAGSLVAATLTQIKMEKRNLRLVAIDGVEPTLQNLEGAKYPYVKALYVVTSGNKNPAVERFILFLRSPKGASVLREADVVQK